MGGRSLSTPSSRHSSRERPSMSNPSSHSKLIVSPILISEMFNFASLYISEIIHSFPCSKLLMLLQTISKPGNFNLINFFDIYLHKMVYPPTIHHFPSKFDDVALTACNHHCRSSRLNLQNNSGTRMFVHFQYTQESHSLSLKVNVKTIVTRQVYPHLQIGRSDSHSPKTLHSTVCLPSR